MTPSFDGFFRAVWNYEPYPWQSRLAREVVSEGWPSVLDLPTGSGKTAVLDIALYHLLVDGGRTASRRIVMVVDRRVIVDQVAERARRLREAVETGATEPTGAARWARETLRDLVGEGVPLLESAVLRGGIVRSDTWARYPHVPLLAASTVDQIGSRLLFRGYGQSRRAQPIHAGLVGCDTLLLLDEVHLARPFSDVLGQLQALRGPESAVPRRTEVVELSATPGVQEDDDAEPFRLGEEDRRNARLARILAAPKPARLTQVRVRVRAPEAQKRAAVAEQAVELALEMVDEGRRAVAVVVNRVDTARRVWERLTSTKGVDRELVTGRMRPLDQANTLARVSRRVMAGRVSDGNDRPLILVATQCIEAGADYDFDGLVTECASLDALRQRFGRLDRRGECRSRVGTDARAAIVARSDDIASTTDPVYGSALAKTWAWLQEIDAGGQVDFGMDRMGPDLQALGDRLREVLAPHRPAPVLLPAYLEQWAQTDPRPHADPDVSLFLHGIPEEGRSTAADVQVVWRGDVTREDLTAAAHGGIELQRLVERMSVVPPGSLESLSLPIWAVKGWLSADPEAEGEDELSDVEGVATDLESEPRTLVLVWRGRRDSWVAEAQAVQPGATVIVPASWGGLGLHRTFDPTASEVVTDMGDIVQLRQRGRATLRLDERVWPGLEEHLAPLCALGEEGMVDLGETVADILGDLRESVPAANETGLVEVLVRLGAKPRIVKVDDLSWVLLERKARSAGSRSAVIVRPGTSSAPDVDPSGGGEEEDDSFLGLRVPLEAHLEGMAELAEDFGRRVGLPEGLVATLRWAGRVHDIGKADPRFQLMLHGGDPVAARFGGTLAKSPIPWQDARVRRRARAVAGYPRGQRHELVSLDMVEGSEALRKAVQADGGDWELLLHLVTSHHGWCRPVAPAVHIAREDADSVTWTVQGIEIDGTTCHDRARLDSGIVRRFFSLARKYGWHEMAYLEAILRLADHRRSAWEAEE